MKPVVSVIIPTHNRATLLRTAIATVYAQEGVGELFDLEVIVVDDASSDETAEAARSYPNVKYIRFDDNRGVAAARNAGVKVATGQYIALLDDDDLWLPHKLRTQVPAFALDPTLGMVYGQCFFGDCGRRNVSPFGPGEVGHGVL